eukprot:CAMPEP_0114508852 /NCGR_PEP_ID=MMETSP0109-20121206/12857_1 /TAXON_ID=29199 /ORGANISM="Chlorarachnion reptans, Strain CCCM449" /LENGTH=89 /DNA_ID=CAMNT_0001687885 /DNA_START=42 /DNA_END=311 /DNA_ORIENTATION=-
MAESKVDVEGFMETDQDVFNEDRAHPSEIQELMQVENMVKGVNKHLSTVAATLQNMEKTMANTEKIVDKWLSVWQNANQKENVGRSNIR